MSACAHLRVPRRGGDRGAVLVESLLSLRESESSPQPGRRCPSPLAEPPSRSRGTRARRRKCPPRIRAVSTVVEVVAHVELDHEATNASVLGVRVGLCAELDDGRRVEVDPAYYGIGGPRRSLGAVWVRYEGDGSELPGFDRKLLERDPDDVVTEALITGCRLRLKDIEDHIRLDLFEGGLPAASPEEGGALDPEEHRRDNERARDARWANLVRALRDADVEVTPALLRAVPFRIEFHENVIDEIAR